MGDPGQGIRSTYRMHATPRKLSDRFYRKATSLPGASTEATATNALLLAIFWELRHQSDLLERGK